MKVGAKDTDALAGICLFLAVAGMFSHSVLDAYAYAFQSMTTIFCG